MWVHRMTRRLVGFLTFLVIASARVTFENAEVLERADLTNDKEVFYAPFECRSTCRVYTPTSKALRIIDDNGKNVTTFSAVRNRAVGKPLELPAGKYFVVNDDGTPSPEFTLYVVQKGAANYDTLVYPFPQKSVNATNQRFVTVLTDLPGLRVVGIDGDFGVSNAAVYATGFDSVSKCRPVFQSRSADNARLTSIVVFGPIATVDFGSDKGAHFVTFDVNYLAKPTTQLESSTVLVSPGYVGCPDQQVFTNTKINQVVQKPYTISSAKGISLKLAVDSAIFPGTPAVVIQIENEIQKLTDTRTITKDYEDQHGFTVFVDWKRGAGDYLSHFAIQIDNFEKTD